MSDEHADLVRDSLRWMVEQLMEAEVSELIGAEHSERAPDRATHRNGYRSRRWDTRAGELELAIPKLRRGSYFPSFLQPRKRSEQALVAVVQEAYVAGCLNTQGRPGSRVARASGIEVRGLAHLRGTRRAGRGLPLAPTRGPLSLSLPRRQGRAD
jgi:hypothetical protein